MLVLHIPTGMQPTMAVIAAHVHWHARARPQARPCPRPVQHWHKNQPARPLSTADWPDSAHPTPYEILDHDSGAPYSKARFYALVKTYHPDTCQKTAAAGGLVCQTLTPAQMLERYRLVVAAHAVFSDPRRRRAYDLYGVGWVAAADRNVSDLQRSRNWKATHSAAYNGTWEDWERWRAEQSGDEGTRAHADAQFPRIPNSAFAFVLLLLGLLGSWAQAVQAREQMALVAKHRRQRHRASTADLLQSRCDSLSLTRAGRLTRFLEHRNRMLS